MPLIMRRITPLKQIVIDAGPLIGFFYAKDTHHSICVAGLTQLAARRTKILAPLPIIFEVFYKWLLQRTYPKAAQDTLQIMKESLHIVFIDAADFETLERLVLSLPQWQGSLEDGTVAMTALRYRCPVWTLNYRDFSIFPSVELWNPD
jgi:predicted nucleic acid-binding protein